jgi:hypothetical protein
MLNEYQMLIEVTKEVEECKKIASSRESVQELQKWINKEAPQSSYKKVDQFTTISEINQDEITEFALPEAGMPI